MLTETEQAILDSIHVASENDPSEPEFPPEDKVVIVSTGRTQY